MRKRATGESLFAMWSFSTQATFLFLKVMKDERYKEREALFFFHYPPPLPSVVLFPFPSAASREGPWRLSPETRSERA